MKRRNRIRAIALLLCMALLPALPAGAVGSVCGSAVDGYTAALAHGAELHENTYWTGSDLRTEHYVNFKPSDGLRTVAVSGETLCSVGSVGSFERRLADGGARSIAAVNGGFYTVSTKEPSGLVIADGVLRADDEGLCAVGFRADGSVLFGCPALRMRLVMDNEELPVDALNKGYAEGTVLYTADFFSGRVVEGCNVLCAADGELTVSGSVTLTVKAVTAEEEAVKIPDGQLLLHSADETAPLLSDLRPGDMLTLETECAAGWESVESGLGILYKLVTDGRAESGLEKTAAPRSAVGVKADGTVILYTMDGRQNGYSVGLGMHQLAERMLELGCVEAGCLDGGGSTNLCAEFPGDSGLSRAGKPSDGAAREVATYIFLVTDQTRGGSAAALTLYPLHLSVMVGASQALTVKAVDADGNAANVPAGVTYSVSGGVGEVAGGVFYAKRAGTGTVTVSAPGVKSASIPVKVVAAPDAFALYGEVYGKLTTSLTLEPGQAVDLTVRAETNHVPLLASDECFTWTLDPAVGTVDGSGHLVPAENSAGGTLTVSAAGKSVSIPITIRAALPFYDVKKSDSFYDAVKFVYDNAIFLGTGETTFEPLTVMNRGMLVTVLWRLSGSPAAENAVGFADVAPDSWYGPAVAWAAECGIVNGYDALTFGPLDDLTKEQILAILFRWSGEEAPEDPALDFTDAADAGQWALGALAWATAPERQLVDADEAGRLLPREPMTRAAVADVLMRYLTAEY